MIRSFWFALISVFVTTTAVAQERAVQLLLPSRQLEPASTFELRFANEMVPADQVGKVAAVSPLVFAPPMEGQFVWLSSRSGTFAPKGILPLGTKYQISLRAGLKDAAGRAVTATLKETAETPPMRVKGVISLVGSDEDDAPAMPRLPGSVQRQREGGGVRKIFPIRECVGSEDRGAGRAIDCDKRRPRFPDLSK